MINLLLFGEVARTLSNTIERLSTGFFRHGGKLGRKHSLTGQPFNARIQFATVLSAVVFISFAFRTPHQTVPPDRLVSLLSPNHN